MKAYFLENNQETEIQNAGKNKRNSSLYHVAVPASYKTDRPFVIVLEMQDNTKEEGEYIFRIFALKLLIYSDYAFKFTR